MQAVADLFRFLPEHETVRAFVALQPTEQSVRRITDYMHYLQNYLPELFIEVQDRGQFPGQLVRQFPGQESEQESGQRPGQQAPRPLVWHAACDLHMTMAFLGMQPISLLRAVWHHMHSSLLLPQRLQALVSSQLSARQLIFLPPHKPSVLAWQLSPSDKLVSLRQELLQALDQVNSMPAVSANFLPHVSLLRMPAPWRRILSEHVPAWLQRHACQCTLEFSQLALYASRDTLSPAAWEIYLQSAFASGCEETARYFKLGFWEITS